jgi:Domain of unknown function (DUF1905)
LTETHTVTVKLWLWTTDKAPASWHFVTIDGEAAEAIEALAVMRRLENGRRRGWGSMKVSATIGDTAWHTSIFPDKSHNGWLLPVKAAVRKTEGLVVGDIVEVTVTL